MTATSQIAESERERGVPTARFAARK